MLQWLEFLYIEKGCISSRSNLSNYLKRLVDKPYEFLEKTMRNGLGVYYLTKKGKHTFAKYLLLNLIKNTPAEFISKNYFEISKPIVENAFFPQPWKQIWKNFENPTGYIYYINILLRREKMKKIVFPYSYKYIQEIRIRLNVPRNTVGKIDFSCFFY